MYRILKGMKRIIYGQFQDLSMTSRILLLFGPRIRQETRNQILSILKRRLSSYLILQIRRGSLPPLDDTTNVDYAEGGEEDLLIWNIRSHWRHFFQTRPHPGRDKLVGVLRTILGSIGVWGSISTVSRHYLHHVEGFVTDLGVSCEAVSPDELEENGIVLRN